MREESPLTPSATLKLAVFDLDGTLKAIRSPYSFVHQALGVNAEAERIFARYQRGDLTYYEWGQEEIALWRDLPVAELTHIISSIPYFPGAKRFVGRLKAAGVKIVVLSAGFDVHVAHWAADLQSDFFFANQLGVADGRLTGRFHGGVDGHSKGDLLRDVQARFGVTREETLAAGDTMHDVPMFPEAALTMAVAPSDPDVTQAADLLLPDGDWTGAWQMIQAHKPGWLPHED